MSSDANGKLTNMDPSSSNVRDAADAVKGIIEAVPVYQDVVQPAAQEVGKALQLVAKTVHIALAPVSILVWGYEQIKDFVSTKVAEKLSGISPEDIIPPKPHIAVPALEALRYTGSQEELSNLYANLLASSMDAKTVADAHPGFVEIIKQLTPDEAKLLKHFSTTGTLPLITLREESGTPHGGGFDIVKKLSYFGEEAGCENVDLVPTYLDNLSRLGLIKIPDNYWYTDPATYDSLFNHPRTIRFKEDIEFRNNAISGLKAQSPEFAIQLAHIGIPSATITKQHVQITELGSLFIKGCVKDHRREVN